MSELSRYQDTSIGAYRLSRLLGVGPVSRVYLAERQDWPGRQVALKLFEAVPLHTLEEKDQALDEVRLLACMEHASILPMLDDGLHEDMLYLVTPYVRGDSLRQRLAASAGKPLPVPEALAIVRQVGEALHFAHTQHIVHANLKPENVLLQENGQVLLADFLLPSLVKSERAARILSTFAALYMAPEQFRGATTPLSDQYALACLAYEMLTGQAPFEADDAMSLARQHATKEPKPPSEFQPACEPYIDHALLKALVKRPEGRYADIQALLAALQIAPVAAAVSIQDMAPTTVAAQTAASASASAVSAPFAMQDSLPEEDGVFDLETVKQPALKTVSAAVVTGMTGMYEAVTTVMRSARPKPLLAGISQHMSIVPALAQPTLSPDHARALSRFSRRQIWLTASLTILVMMISISGLVLFLNAATVRHQPPTRKGAVVLTSSPTTTTGPVSPVATATATAAGVPASGSPTATATAIATPRSTATPSPTPAPRPTATPTPTPQPTPTPTPVPAASLSCTVAYSLSSQWPGSFIANLTITNTGTSIIQGWTLVFTFPNRQRIYYGWSGSFAQHGEQVTITNADFNGTLKPGTTATPAFQAASNGPNNRPASFALNGVTCQ